MKYLLQNFFIRHKNIFRLYFKKILSLGLLMLFISLLGSVLPNVFGVIIDSITTGMVRGTITFMVISSAITIAKAILVRFESTHSPHLIFQMVNKVKIRVFAQIIRSKKNELDKFSSSEIINRLEASIETAVSFFVTILKNSTLIVVNCIVALYFMLSISLTMTLVSLIVFPLTIVITNLFKKVVYNGFDHLKQRQFRATKDHARIIRNEAS